MKRTTIISWILGFALTAAAAIPALAAEPAPALEVQVLLDRASFSPGVIDGQGGENTRKALAAFQAAHDLPVTGEADASTLQNLRAASGREILRPYTITPEDALGPFASLPEDTSAQSHPGASGYSTLGELLGERFHATPELLRQLNPESNFAAGAVIQVPASRPAAVAGNPPAEARVVVSRQNGTLTVEQGDDILFFAPATAGSEHEPLPLGEWKVRAVLRDPVYRGSAKWFWDPEAKTAPAQPPGPNSPVGVVWIDLDREHYGIHGTPEPAQVGNSAATAARGCVRLTNWDALTVASLVRPGTPVRFEAGAPAFSATSEPSPAVAVDGDLAELLRHDLLLPVQGVRREDLRDSFADRRSGGRTHRAEDIMAPRNTPILAVEDGTVARLLTSRLGGRTIYQLDASETYVYSYAHLERYASGLKEGDAVHRGQVLGYVGTSGNAPPRSPHLHFAIARLTAEKKWWKGTPVDPFPILHHLPEEAPLVTDTTAPR